MINDTSSALFKNKEWRSVFNHQINFCPYSVFLAIDLAHPRKGFNILTDIQIRFSSILLKKPTSKLPDEAFF